MVAGLKELQPGLSSSWPEEVSRLNLQKFGGRVLEFSRRTAGQELELRGAAIGLPAAGVVGAGAAITQSWCWAEEIQPALNVVGL
ncbi:unnamed protein product [Prunus armeniaca]|uniref:Uncharacterized protein n=1 Tax=Prunus armeniaca TaxID=36596 RepID=A0A6J5WVZ4_PRUAR|nr:unnamed protein product [Prunus armeniaca]